MTYRADEIQRQEFLMRAKPGLYYDLVVCPRCCGHGQEPAGFHGDDTVPCRACGGHRVVQRRVSVRVDDVPVGSRFPR
ncbi:MAG: hypothetical protein KUA35_09195 [Pseudodesulfovibrio sp.]|uniref:Uncharacterized protein n=1 Tax=Pseudodesulfovibrio aespoeensis (strain ATCC 700646 / DSM 10631 / Aspo-2) TaxID=643562 RepID=E6VX50_PSEA9|nr:MULTISPECIES: hypothetical protein [Pseudodesulfovibrio]MBU4379791.1 hypothetical protein [Pseudomonadota bacterium]ADU61456.1 hypothetical protein Daes_0433 [Pseudodesulfovibrio aespoeensis Aspo-2]MBU4475245.1 hypothetical protein [Pseudomonadota bacterium]MBU4516284.1 hypothetical protein [Pseudomonadota bacterium]MBU4522463.1 hypothetical protein [Pseudomonadota bacterium]